MAGGSLKQLRREALERREQGLDPKPGDEDLLPGGKYGPGSGNNPKEDSPVLPPAKEADGVNIFEVISKALTITPDMARALDRVIDEPPGATFSHQTVQRFAMAGASDKDIAAIMGIDVKQLAEAEGALTLGRTIQRFLLTHRQTGAGLGGDRTMLVWLGKNKLGQTDRLATTDGADEARETQAAAMRARVKLDRILEIAGAQFVPGAPPLAKEVMAPAWKSLPAVSDDQPAE